MRRGAAAARPSALRATRGRQHQAPPHSVWFRFKVRPQPSPPKRQTSQDACRQSSRGAPPRAPGRAAAPPAPQAWEPPHGAAQCRGARRIAPCRSPAARRPTSSCPLPRRPAPARSAPTACTQTPKWRAPCSLDAACTLPRQGALCAWARSDRRALGWYPVTLGPKAYILITYPCDAAKANGRTQLGEHCRSRPFTRSRPRLRRRRRSGGRLAAA